MYPYAVSILSVTLMATHISLLQSYMVVHMRNPFLEFHSIIVRTRKLLCMLILYDGGSEWLNYFVYWTARMSEPVQNNAETHIGDNLDNVKGSGDQASHNVPPSLSGMPPIPSELANNIGNPNYWYFGVWAYEMNSTSTYWDPSYGYKPPYRVAQHNPKVYGKYDQVKLEEWIWEMEKIFTILEVPEDTKVNIGMFYLTGEANIWWNTIKDRLLRPDFTWSRFLEELRAKFYPVVVQQQKEKEFIELKMSGSMTVMQYASKFTELSRFVPKFMLSERLKMRRFEEGLGFYIRNQLVG